MIMLGSRRLMSTIVNSKPLKAFDQIPTVRGLPIIGTAITFLLTESSNRLHKYMDRRHKKMGPIIQESIGPVRAVFVSDPEIMRTVFTKHEGKYPVHVIPEPWTLYNEIRDKKRGLFFLKGEEWLHYRRILNRLVLKPDAESWLKTPITEATDNAIHHWRKMCTKGQFEPVMPDDMYKASILMMLSVVLGSAFKPFAHENDEVIGEFANRVHKIFVHSAKMVKLPAKYYMKFKFPAWKHFTKSVDDSIQIGEELMEKMYRMNDSGDGLLFKLKNEKFSEEDMSRIVIDFIMAAGDTTATTTQWALYLLCKNPEVLERYLSIIDKDVEANTYCRGIIRETLRLYPPAPFVTRLLPEDCEIAGYHVPAGTMISMSIYSSSRDPRYFPEPMKFDPTRWDKNEDAPGINAYSQASMPFAIGTRSCIGRKIAMLQITELLKKINLNFEIKLLNENIEDIMQMVTVPNEPFRFIFKDRHYEESIKIQN